MSSPTYQWHFDTRRKLSLPSTSTNTHSSLLVPHLHLPPNNLPSHLSPATQTLLRLLKALALLLLFAVDPDNSGGDTDGNGEDWVQSSKMKE
jgi:hypothetical protein